MAKAQTQKSAPVSSTPAPQKKETVAAAAAAPAVAVAAPAKKVVVKESAKVEAPAPTTEVAAPETDDVSTRFNTLIEKMQTIQNEWRDVQNEMKKLQKEVVKQFKEASKGSKKKVKNLDKPKRNPSGFAKPATLSKDLCDFLKKPYGTELARTDVTKFLTKYIKDNSLQLESDKRVIIPDAALHKLLNTTKEDKITYFNLQKFMKPHFPAKAS